jgi:phosphatidylethanolamine-binding protein (PEBP) family uncharacterized protein
MVQFTVQYGQTNANGKLLTKKNTVSEPTVLFTGDPDTLYTVLMTDPDAPVKSWLHWLLVNIPGDSNDIFQGEAVMTYTGPSPPSGTHRYIFTLYKQPAGSIMVTKPYERGNFPVEAFEKQHSLQKIVSRTLRVSK